MSARVTLQTIADHLGVSRTTISNAYNRPDQLTVELRSRIMAAADELGYPGPSAAGRMLRTGRIGTIGLVFTADLKYVFSDPDTALFMRGVAQASASARTGLTLLPAPPGVGIEATALGTAPVDGYIVYSVSDEHPAINAVLERQVPVVIVDEPDLGIRTSFVGIDDRAGAQIAARHVVDLGHTNIGLIVDRLSDEPERRRVPPTTWPASTIRIARARLEGYRDALMAGGIDTTAVPIWEAGGNDPDSGRRAALELLHAHPELTALLCTTDQVAMGAAQAADSIGQRVPDDLTVVGFDDIPRASTFAPALSTIRQPLVDKGRLATELLMAQIGDGVVQRVELPIELVVRESSAPVRS